MTKYVFILASIMLIVPALLCSCSTDAKTQIPITVTCDEFSQQKAIVKGIDAKVGDVIVVTLCSNRTTGFSWPEKAQISVPQVLEQTSYKWVPPANTGVVGAAGQEVWTFKALQPGPCSVSLEYSQQWAGGQKAAWTFRLNLTVQ